MDERKRGFLLVLCTAVISGFSVFINSFAIAKFDPFVFTALRNGAIGLSVLSFIYLTGRASELGRVPRREWLKLAVWGAFDGGVAFMLYFYGLKLTTAANAALLHKTIFVFASAMAAVFLKERLSRIQIGATLLLLFGAFLLSGLSYSEVGVGEGVILAAVLLWSAGNVIAKKLLEKISSMDVIFARMFFGSLFIFAFLALRGGMPELSSLTPNHYIWLVISSLLLIGYQLTYFNGLALLKVSEATSVLVLGSVITSLLSILVMQLPSPAELLGMIAVVGSLAVIYFAPAEVEDVHRKTIPRG